METKEEKLRRTAWDMGIRYAREFINNTPFYKKQCILTYIKDAKGKDTQDFTKQFEALHLIYWPIAYDELKYATSNG